MTSPRNSSSRGGKRFYTWRNEKYWSVTTILSGGIPKPALLPWGIKSVATAAVEMCDQVAELCKNGRGDEAIALLKAAPYAQRDRAANLGTSVHAAVEAYVLGQPQPDWPEDIAPRMQAFEEFLVDYEPTYEMTEASVYNRAESYAGTLDAILTLGRGPHAGRSFILDVKTGKGVYPEVALQLAAYRRAEFIGLPDGGEAPMPEVDGACCLHIPETGGYELVDVDTGPEVFKSFLYAREVFRWQEVDSKSVLLGPITREKERAA